MPQILQLVIPFLLDMLKEYIKSSDTTQDDKVLAIVQEGAKYLAPSENNTLKQIDSNVISNAKMCTWDDE